MRKKMSINNSFGTRLSCGCQHNPMTGYSMECLGRKWVHSKWEDLTNEQKALVNDHNHSTVERWFPVKATLKASIGDMLKCSPRKLELLGFAPAKIVA